MLFDKRLSQLRKEKGISQKQCAAELGIESSKYNKWENGKNCPDYNTVCMLADFFDTTTDYLLGNSDERYKNKKDNLKAWQNGVIAHVTNNLIKFFDEYNEYKKGDNTMSLKNVFTLATLGQVRKCIDSQANLLKNVSKINQYQNLSDIDKFISKYSSELGEINFGGFQDDNGVWINSIGAGAIIRALKGEIEKKVPDFKNYKIDFNDEWLNFSIMSDDDD